MAQYTKEIREIQMLMIRMLCLSPQGKLRELFDTALKASESQTLARITPCTDTSADGLKAWLESLLAQGGITPEEQKLLDWQNNSDNMNAAIEEVVALENKLGLDFIFEKKS